MRGYFGDPSEARFDRSSGPRSSRTRGCSTAASAARLVLRRRSSRRSSIQWRLFRAVEAHDDRYWTAAVSAANIGTLALVFSFVPFATQVGMQFWFLEGALHGAMTSRLRRRDDPWLLVAGDFTPLGGMDGANHALARYLAVRADGRARRDASRLARSRARSRRHGPPRLAAVRPPSARQPAARA